MSVYAGDGEPIDRWDSRVRRSKIERKRCACRQPIKPGELYHRTAMLYDGNWDVTERCARCEAMFRILSPLMDRADDIVCDPCLNCGHTWRENFGEDPPPEVQALAFLTPSEAQVLLERSQGFEWEQEVTGLHGPLEKDDALTRRLLRRFLPSEARQ